MTRLSMTGSLLAFVAGAILVAPGTEAIAQDLTAHCASVGDDHRVKPIPAALVPEARRLFGGGPDQSVAAPAASTVSSVRSAPMRTC